MAAAVPRPAGVSLPVVEPAPVPVPDAVRQLGQAIGTSAAIIAIATRLARCIARDFDDRNAVAAGALYVASRQARKPITTGVLAARCKTTRARFDAAIKACAHFA